MMSSLDKAEAKHLQTFNYKDGVRDGELGILDNQQSSFHSVLCCKRRRHLGCKPCGFRKLRRLCL